MLPGQLYPLKTLENLWFPDVLTEYKVGILPKMG